MKNGLKNPLTAEQIEILRREHSVLQAEIDLNIAKRKLLTFKLIEIERKLFNSASE